MKKNLLVLDDTSMNITRDDGFVFRREDPNDKNFMIEYLELWKKCFGESEKCSREWYEWINLNCPSGNNNLYVARDETTNKLVSAYGMLPFEVVKKGKIHRSNLCTNVMTDHDHRGRSLFTKLGKIATSDQKKTSGIQLGIPNDNALAGHMKVGWKRMNDIPFYETQISKLPEVDFDIEQHNDFSSFDDASISKFHEKYDLYVKKDVSFLNWRFCNHPISKYKIFSIKGSSGYIVTKLFITENLRKLHVVDFCYDKLDEFERLITISQLEAKKSEASIVNMWVTSDDVNLSSEAKVLRSLKFNRSSNSNKFILMCDEDLKELDFNKFHIVLGDNDVF